MCCVHTSFSLGIQDPICIHEVDECKEVHDPETSLNPINPTPNGSQALGLAMELRIPASRRRAQRM